MRNRISTSGWYSIIAAVLMIGILLILTTSTLNLVLSEMNDGKGRQDYLKAFYGAWAAQELALLKIKDQGYGYDEDGGFTNTQILWNTRKDAEVSFVFESKVEEYSGVLQQGETQIIPLFWIDDTGNISSITDIDFDVSLWNISWNIIWENSWESWINDFSSLKTTNTKALDIASGDFTVNTSWNIGDFLSNNPGSYLAIFNSQSTKAQFTLSSPESFSLPVAQIMSSGTVGKYTQNLETSVDNTEFLGILKYSIYSWN